MAELRVELLSPERVVALWDEVCPLLDNAAKANDLAITDASAANIYLLTQTDQAVIFAGSDADGVALVVALQFTTVNGQKGADILALAGRRLLSFKAAFWQPVLAWLRANDCAYIDAYASERLAKLYRIKFGFSKACAVVRMDL